MISYIFALVHLIATIFQLIKSLRVYVCVCTQNASRTVSVHAKPPMSVNVRKQRQLTRGGIMQRCMCVCVCASVCKYANRRNCGARSAAVDRIFSGKCDRKVNEPQNTFLGVNWLDNNNSNNNASVRQQHVTICAKWRCSGRRTRCSYTHPRVHWPLPQLKHFTSVIASRICSFAQSIDHSHHRLNALFGATTLSHYKASAQMETTTTKTALNELKMRCTLIAKSMRTRVGATEAR